MSTKPTNPNESSTFMPSAKGDKNETLATSSQHETSTLTISPEPEVVASLRSRSRANEFFESHEFRLAWDNDVKHSLARSIVHLRRYRKMSQARVASEMGTSQSAIARIEAGEENLTASTLQRLIAALKGRFMVSIPPQEVHVPRFAPWWDSPPSSSTGPWDLKFMAHGRSGGLERVVVGLERERGTLPENPLMITSATTY